MPPHNNSLLAYKGRNTEAERIHERETEIWEKTLGPDHPTVATSLINRVGLLTSMMRVNGIIIHIIVYSAILFWCSVSYHHPPTFAQGKYAEAELLSQRSQGIQEKALSPDHPGVAQLFNNRAELFRAQVRVVRNSKKLRRAHV